MKTLQTVLDLPVDSVLRPGLCRVAVNAFRREDHRQEEADAIEAILHQYFLFECARRIPIPPPKNDGRRRQRRFKRPRELPVPNNDIQAQCTILGLNMEDAQNQALIERAFRRAAINVHPDKWGHLPEHEKRAKVEEFKTVVNARDTLITRLAGQASS